LRRIIVVLIIALLLTSCETKQQTPEPSETVTNATPVNETNSTETIIVETKDVQVFIPRLNNLTIYFLDINGSSSIIQYKDNSVLIVAGFREDSEKILKSIRNLGIESLDYIFATNAQPKNIGGMPYLILRTSPENVVENGIPSSIEYKEYKDLYNETIIIKYDQTFFLEDFSVKVEVAYDDGIGFSSDLDDNSLVLRVHYGNSKFLFMSDCGLDCEERLKDTDVSADVIKISSSCDSTSLSFLQRVNPKVAVVSAQKDFCPNVVERFRFLDVPLHITGERGDIFVTTDGLNSYIDWNKNG